MGANFGWLVRIIGAIIVAVLIFNWWNGHVPAKYEIRVPASIHGRNKVDPGEIAEAVVTRMPTQVIVVQSTQEPPATATTVATTNPTVSTGDAAPPSGGGNGQVWGGDNKETVNGKQRHVSGKCGTCTATFQPGDAVYGYTILDENMKIICDGGDCYSENISFAGSVVDGVVNPWKAEVPSPDLLQIVQ